MRAGAWSSLQNREKREMEGKDLEVLVVTCHVLSSFNPIHDPVLPPHHLSKKWMVRWGNCNHFIHICVHHVCLGFCLLNLWLTFLRVITPCMWTRHRARTYFPTLQPYHNKTFLRRHVQKNSDTHTGATMGTIWTSVWLPSCLHWQG